MDNFIQVKNLVILDKDLTRTAKVVFCTILTHVNNVTHECTIFVKTLAKEVACSKRTIQRALTQLIEKKLISRESRYDSMGNQLSSIFRVLTPVTKTTPTNDTDVAQNNYTNNNYNKEPLKGKPDSPVDDSNPKIEKDVPEILRSTARYLLQRTGRKNLTWKEVSILKKLSQIHMPVRIQKEIDRAYERFVKKGKNLLILTFQYIYSTLESQKPTFTPKPKTSIVTDSKNPAPTKEFEKVLKELAKTRIQR